jgi:hypothetical protein
MPMPRTALYSTTNSKPSEFFSGHATEVKQSPATRIAAKTQETQKTSQKEVIKAATASS